MKKFYADMDPLEEVRAIREEISREFKTIHDLGEYLREKHPGIKSPSESLPQSCGTVVKKVKRPSVRRGKSSEQLRALMARKPAWTQ
ncbi:MAG: hypothetical protein FWD61_04415 [Phycisphaerales bacterium]|nr:hypothetical protein [Phycisphaerales bacterium]